MNNDKFMEAKFVIFTLSLSPFVRLSFPYSVPPSRSLQETLCKRKMKNEKKYYQFTTDRKGNIVYSVFEKHILKRIDGNRNVGGQ
jgi:hypothetical protein